MGYCGWCPYVNKWWTFTVSLAVALCAGLTYDFSIWGGELKKAFALRQSQLELIASAANIGGYSGIFSGLLYDRLERHKRFGPRIVLVLGCLLNAGGYLGLWAALNGLFAAQFWHLAALAFVAANAGSWLDTTIMATNVRNFPSSRGTVVGLLKAAIGLSGSLFASVYSGIFAPNRTPFLVCLALAPAAVGLLALPFINTCTFVQVCELQTGQDVFTTEGRFIFALQALGTLAVYLITGATVTSLYPLSTRERLIMTAGAGLLLLPLLLIPHGSGGLLSQKAVLHHTLSVYHRDDEEEEEEEEGGLDGGAEGSPGSGGGGDEESGRLGAAAGSQWAADGAAGGEADALKQPLLVPPAAGGQNGGMQRDGPPSPGSDGQQPLSAGNSVAFGSPVLVASPERPVPSLAGRPDASSLVFPELSPGQCLRSSSFWLLFAALTISMGSGLTLLNNLSQLVRALAGVPRQDTPVLVSLFSVSNCAGRLVLGYFPERLLHSRGTPRLLFLPLMSALMSAACLALAFAHMPMLYPLAALTGFAFGGHWTLFPSLVSELFGLTRFAANYTLAMLAPALGSFTLAMGLASWLYDRAVERHGGGAAGEACVGQDCFQATFICLAALGVGATACSTLLYRKVAVSLYRKMQIEVHSFDEEVQRPGGEPAGGRAGGRGDEPSAARRRRSGRPSAM